MVYPRLVQPLPSQFSTELGPAPPIAVKTVYYLNQLDGNDWVFFVLWLERPTWPHIAIFPPAIRRLRPQILLAVPWKSWGLIYVNFDLALDRDSTHICLHSRVKLFETLSQNAIFSSISFCHECSTMNWLPRFAFRGRSSREAGSTTGRGRLFVYLALTAIALLLSYQLVLNRESLSSVSRWAAGKGLTPGVNHAESNGNQTSEGKPEAHLMSQKPREKELVLAAMSYSNMSWVQENLPNWYTNIYRADVPPGEAALTVPVNKGNEAMVFLTYVYIFLHGI